LAHPSAPLFSGILLCVGRQRISVSTVGSRCYRLPCLKGVGLAQAGLVMRHPRDRGLCIVENADFRCMAFSAASSRAPRTPRLMPPENTPCGPTFRPSSIPSSTPPRTHRPVLISRPIRPEHQPRLRVRPPLLLFRSFRVRDRDAGAEFYWPILRQVDLFHPPRVFAEVDHLLSHGHAAAR